MIKKTNVYDYYQRYVKDKDKAVSNFIDNTLAKTQSMFVYDGLPESLPQSELEQLLQVGGNAFVTEVDGKLYAFSGGAGGTPDVYNRPTEFIVSNPALGLNKTYKIGTDGVLVKNDTHGNSLLNIIGGYAVLHVDTIISLNTASILSRIPMLISASDDKTKESADTFINKILDGDFSIIGENAFFKGITTHSTQSNTSMQLSQLIELIQYYKASMLNELGLNANYNMKRERLNTSEVSMNIDVLLPYVDNMLVERKKAVKAINDLYGTDITVELASTWEITHNELDHRIEGDEVEEVEEVENDPLRDVNVENDPLRDENDPLPEDPVEPTEDEEPVNDEEPTEDDPINEPDEKEDDPINEPVQEEKEDEKETKKERK